MILNINAKNYEIVYLIGFGAYGKVYLAQDTVTKKQVVIKEITKTLRHTLSNAYTETSILYQFKRECSKYLVCIIGYKYSSKHVYIVLEFIPYTIDLEHLLGHHEPNLYTTYTIATRLLKGLYVLHENNVVHRDIKPANIIVDRDMNPHYIDYGLSCSLIWNTEPCLRKICGTQDYMAPEVTDIVDTVNTKEAGQMWAHADVFSLGCVFYELLYVSRYDNWPKTFNKLCRSPRNTNISVVRGINTLKALCEDEDEIEQNMALFNVVSLMLQPRDDRASLELLIDMMSEKDFLLPLISRDRRRININITKKFGFGKAISKSMSFSGAECLKSPHRSN